MRKGRVRLGEERVYSLAYADDVVLLAEEEEGIKCLISRLEKYLDEKGLELNREKTKVMRFRKGGERMKKVSWVWKGKKIEVKKIKYVDYVL